MVVVAYEIRSDVDHHAKEKRSCLITSLFQRNNVEVPASFKSRNNSQMSIDLQLSEWAEAFLINHSLGCKLNV